MTVSLECHERTIGEMGFWSQRLQPFTIVQGGRDGDLDYSINGGDQLESLWYLSALRLLLNLKIAL